MLFPVHPQRLRGGGLRARAAGTGGTPRPVPAAGGLPGAGPGGLAADPLLLTERLGVPELLAKAERLIAALAGCTRKLVFSFADLDRYAAVRRGLARAGIAAREFTPDEMRAFARAVWRTSTAPATLNWPRARRKRICRSLALGTTAAWTGTCSRGFGPATGPWCSFWASSAARKDKGQRARPAAASPARTSAATAPAPTGAPTATPPATPRRRCATSSAHRPEVPEL